MLVGALARIDVVKIPAQTIYLTVWASDEVSCHYGRTDRAQERCMLANCCVHSPCPHMLVRYANLANMQPTVEQSSACMTLCMSQQAKQLYSCGLCR